MRRSAQLEALARPWPFGSGGGRRRAASARSASRPTACEAICAALGSAWGSFSRHRLSGQPPSTKRHRGAICPGFELVAIEADLEASLLGGRGLTATVAVARFEVCRDIQGCCRQRCDKPDAENNLLSPQSLGRVAESPCTVKLITMRRTQVVAPKRSRSRWSRSGMDHWPPS